MFESQFEEKLKMVESPFEEEPRYRETRLHPSVSKFKVDEQLIQEKQTVLTAPKPQINNWQLNPPKDEEDEQPTEPRFNPLFTQQ